MSIKKRFFETRGPVDPNRNYVVPRTDEITDLVHRINDGRYIVISAPRQTGKTTFFRWALNSLDATYLPVQLNFEIYQDVSPEKFYHYFKKDIQKEIKASQWQNDVCHFVENSDITSHVEMMEFFEQLGSFLKNQRLVIIIDEFDGIPTSVVGQFLHTLRRIYLSKTTSFITFWSSNL